ncbi:MAG: carboxymuconolactone decarboxylase family protein [Pseudobacteriovorax sp.]|nr:carboxymuconolactone decarboxylase family protein [Pseudobacteriovorax sp.]
MKQSSREPSFKYSLEEVIQKSAIAKEFLEARSIQNEAVEEADNKLLKRIYNIDHNAYMEGSLNASTKELMGLVASLSLRCDDCINYHIIQAYRLDVARSEVEEAMNVATVVGGTIVIPHLRRAYQLLSELY